MRSAICRSFRSTRSWNRSKRLFEARPHRAEVVRSRRDREISNRLTIVALEQPGGQIRRRLLAELAGHIARRRIFAMRALSAAPGALSPDSGHRRTRARNGAALPATTTGTGTRTARTPPPTSSASAARLRALGVEVRPVAHRHLDVQPPPLDVCRESGSSRYAASYAASASRIAAQLLKQRAASVIAPRRDRARAPARDHSSRAPRHADSDGAARWRG